MAPSFPLTAKVCIASATVKYAWLALKSANMVNNVPLQRYRPASIAVAFGSARPISLTRWCGQELNSCSDTCTAVGGSAPLTERALSSHNAIASSSTRHVLERSSLMMLASKM